MVLDARDCLLKEQITLTSENGEEIPLRTTLTPSVISRRTMATFTQSATAFAELVLSLSNNITLLTDILAPTSDADPFTSRLLAIAQKHPQRPDDILCNWLRSDYFIENDGSIKQVELNTIAVSFATMATRVASFHRQMGSCGINQSPQVELSTLITKAASLHSGCTRRPFVIFVVQPNETNLADQAAIADGIDADVTRMTLSELADLAVGSDGELSVGGRVVDCAYFRAGYDPGDYPTEAEWRARELIESTRVVKIPTAPMQLAGAKKVQQALCDRGMLERALSAQAASVVEPLFTTIVALEDQPTPAVVNAIEHPERFVLKPQREGGGWNLFDDDVRTALQGVYPTAAPHVPRALGSDCPHIDPRAWILMHRIRPEVTERYVVQCDGSIAQQALVSEYGVFVSMLARGSQMVQSGFAGVLVRSKGPTVQEGGIMHGQGILDGICVK
ncbi:Glutathione synthase, eukaryotic [Carpediemonas membranifera]|uniref:Glutathione synthetase n=1 Tax=Carpediemonas membranifera TaxID=201153 RepID=A0A8J6E8D1_9EUKA|nr:Glutathione synthase, eukaryotic [Carpediemonas membranifera]|eukprot:KAG9391735.1 Glutathione synthase, eukaryotic [Carpediemonas membranifera]